MFKWKGIGELFKGGKEIAEVFTENKENKGQRAHLQEIADVDRDRAVLGQFASEFHDRSNRTWWDSFVDGLNRLPRPLLTIVVIAFFVLAPLDPPRFLEIAKAYELIPPGYWALLSVIIGFYFGGRMQLKSQDMVVRKDAIQVAKDLVVMRKEFRQLEVEEESTASKIFDALEKEGKAQLGNKVIKQWLEGRNNNG